MRSYANIKEYLQHRGRDELANTLNPGYCHAIALFFCYCALTNKLNLCHTLLTEVDHWQEDSAMLTRIAAIKKTLAWQKADKKLFIAIKQDPQLRKMDLIDQIHEGRRKGILLADEAACLLSALLPDHPSIEKLLNIMEWLQRQLMRHYFSGNDASKLELMRDRADINNFNVQSDFEAAFICPRHQLRAVIEQCPLNRPVLLSTGRHSVSFYRVSTGYHYCNYEYQLQTTDVTELVFDFFKFSLGNHLPLSLTIFSLKKQPRENYSALSMLCNKMLNDPALPKQSSFLSFHEQIARPRYPDDGMTPLILAILGHQQTVMTALLKRDDLDLQAIDGLGFSAIHYAALNREYALVDTLIKRGVSINPPVGRCKINLDVYSESLHYSIIDATPLYLASAVGDIAMIELLITHGADLNSQTEMGVSPLAIAAIRGHHKVVEWLLHKKAKINTLIDTIKEKKRSLYLSGFHTHKLPIEYLGAVDMVIFSGLDAITCGIFSAARKNQTNVVLDLLQRRPHTAHIANAYGITCLHLAVYNNNEHMLNALIAENADVNAPCFSPWSLPSKKKIDPLWIAMEYGYVNIAEILLKAGANADIQYCKENSQPDRTALHMAAEKGAYTLVNLLIKYRAHTIDVNNVNPIQQEIVFCALLLNLDVNPLLFVVFIEKIQIDEQNAKKTLQRMKDDEIKKINTNITQFIANLYSPYTEARAKKQCTFFSKHAPSTPLEKLFFLLTYINENPQSLTATIWNTFIDVTKNATKPSPMAPNMTLC